jgi:iron complex transport system substrate-binding protein
MSNGFADIASKSSDSGKTVYFEVSPLEYGLWTAGTGTFMDELATLTGLKNVFADVSGWGEISAEQVLSRDPDYIVTITMYFGDGPTPVDEIKSREGWQDLKAIANDDILNADSNEISRPGPRLLDAAYTIYEFVNGGAAVEPAA